MMRRIYMTAALVACIGFLSGCAALETEPDQQIQDVQQHPSENVTLLQTYQTPGQLLFFQGVGHEGPVYWYCNKEGSELICDQSCGHDVECPASAGLVQADRSPAAQWAGGEQPVVEQQAGSEEPEVAAEDEDQPEADDVEEEQ